MKLVLSICCTLTICQVALAQDRILFDHDASGNRVQRLFQAGALPVTLISFNAVLWLDGKEQEGEAALLTWETSTEINANRFEIQRSQNGEKWMHIGNVTASAEGKSRSLYSFLDNNPMGGGSVSTENLYRLKMIDNDETYSFSRIRSVRFENPFFLYPNPVTDQLKLKGIAVENRASGRVQLFDNIGKMVFNSERIPAQGINMSNLKTGIYVVKITNTDGTVIIRKVLKE